MSLSVRVEEGRSGTKVLVLQGRLDHDSVGAFDDQLDEVLLSKVQILVFDLSGLEYVTSAGLRSIFRAQKAMSARGGKAVLVSPQVQVRKVLDIVKVPELGSVFASVQELDAYLDAIQRKTAGGQ
jgi:anti-anti-sigma factor